MDYRRLNPLSNTAARAFLLSVICAALTYAHNHPAYSHDSNQKTANERWMTFMRDAVPLSRMSIPGTHDSLSLYWGPMAQTQTMNLDTQLKSGIRALDVRCKNVSGTLMVFHGDFYMYTTFDEVLTTITSFLAANPGEAVLMRVKPEGATFAVPANISLGSGAWHEVFARYWNDSRYASFFWQASNITNPTLGQMRGKIVVLQDFESPKRYGIPYAEFKAQDEYNIDQPWQLYDKWLKVKAKIFEARDTPETQKHINYLSAAGAVVNPHFVASGHVDPATDASRMWTGISDDTLTGSNRDKYPDFPRLDCLNYILGQACSVYFEGTNVLTQNLLEDLNRQNQVPRLGIVMADYPGPGLIDRIIAQNSVFTSEVLWSRGQPCLSRTAANTVLASNGWERLVWQSDGNLVLYDAKGPRWSTATNSPTTSLMCFQGDGNLVIYDPGKSGGVSFSTSTHGRGEKLLFQYDCNLVIYDAAGKPVWASRTNPCRR